MPQPRFTFLNPGARRIAIVGFGTLPVIDKTRVTANLIRQSGKGADIEYVESREHQLGLQDYSALLYGDDTPRVLLYDEGAGVSGQKRIDQRKVLDRLYRDINAGIVGTIVVGREDRLFRNKHMDQVGPFTKLCEEKRVKIIVPSTESGKTRVYDFTRYQDLLAFQEKMKEAYGYIEGHVKYMHQCQHEKADKGGYDGRTLPPGFAVKGRKQDQIIVVYEPWAEVMRKLALRARALDWDMGKLNREVAQQAYLFREIPDEAREKYIIKTTLRLIPEVGYKPRNSQTIKQWLTNVMYIGWWKPDLDKPDTIPGHHDAILDYALFAEGYARLTGYTLDGVPVDSPKGVTRIRKTRDTPPDALFHGRLLATPPSQDRTTYTSVDEDRAKLYYRGYSAQEHGMLIDKLFSVPVAPFDAIVIERLKALVAVDKRVRDRVKTTLEQVYDQQSTDFVSVNDQLEGIKKQLGENAKKRMKTSVDDPLYAMLEEELNDLQQRQKLLEGKKEKLGMVDSPQEIAELHCLLGNFDAVWPKLKLDKKQRAFSLLINRIEVEVVSPHWLRLSIDWLDALCPRVDVAYLWRATPARCAPMSDSEAEIIRQHYPSSPQLEILRLLPTRTWSSIQTYTNGTIRRLALIHNNMPIHACYYDLSPKLDGKYLFGNYETTLGCIREACSSADKYHTPLYAKWLLSSQVEDLESLYQWDLNVLGVTICISPKKRER